MKKSPRKISYRIRVFMIYLLVAIIPVLIFIGVVETQYIDELKTHTLDRLADTSDALVGTLDDCMNQIKTVGNTLIMLEDTKKTYRPSQPEEANDLRDRLAVYVTHNALLEELALYEPGNQYLFSSQSSYTLDLFLRMKNLEYLTADQINAMLYQYTSPILLRTTGESAFCVLYPVRTLSDTRGLFAFIPAAKLNVEMREALVGNEGYCQIANGAGTVWFHYTSDGIIPDQSVIDQCLAGARTVREDAKTLYCANSSSATTRLSVSVIARDGSIHQSIRSIRWKWGILLVSSIVLSFVASWLTAVINTKPILELSKRISTNIREKERGANEIEHIDASIRHLNDVATTAKKQIDEVADYLTFRLLCGTIERVDDANQLSQVLGTSVYADAYQVCILDSGSDSPAREVAARIRKLLPPDTSMLIRRFDAVLVCVFFCALDDQNAMDVLSEKFLHQYPAGKLSFGNSYSRMSEIPLSFMEAYLAARNEDAAVAAFGYDEQVTAAISQFAQAMESNDIRKILALFRQICENIENATYTLDQAKCICVRICHILSESSLSKRLTAVLPNAYIVISTETQEMLLKLMAAVTAELETIRKEHVPIPANPPLVDQLKEYLLANYRNTNFSLQQMAFDFRTTPSMLSRYFKEHYGQSINDYLNDLKMERARMLLLETSLSVYEVGLELGYQGPNSFIRRFKATYGITPGEFRQSEAPED